MLAIHEKLQGAEARKARDLLSMAMSHHEAFKIVRKNIEDKILAANGQNNGSARDVNGLPINHK